MSALRSARAAADEVIADLERKLRRQMPARNPDVRYRPPVQPLSARDAAAQAAYAAAFIVLMPIVVTAGIGIAVWAAWQNRKDRR